MIAGGHDSGSAMVARPAGRSPLADELRRLGPIHLRIGHYLATRPDVLNAADREALIDVGDQIPQCPWPTVRTTLTAGLGADFSEMFSAVEPAAVWSTGIAQLHRGRLSDDTPVTIKVVRPGAIEAVQAAQQWLPEGLPALLARFASPPPGDLADVSADVSGWLERQTDLTIEATLLARLLRLRRLTEWEHVPRPFLDLCTTSVLVCEDEGGVAASEVAAASAERLRELHIDPVRLARAVLTVTLRQGFRYRLFQTDLHPDNVVALPGNIVSYSDWSSFGQLDPALEQDELTYLSAVFDGDTERALDPPTDMVVFDEEGDVAAFRRDLLGYLRERALADSDQREESAPVALLGELLRSGRAHRIGLPEGARLLCRSLVAADTTAQRLDPAVDTAEVGRRALEAARVGEKIRTLGPDRVEGIAYDLAALLRDTPGQLQKILSELADGTFSVNVWVAEVAQAERNRNRRTRLLVAAIVSVSLAVTLSAPELPDLGGVSLAWPIGITLASVYAWLLLEWRRLR